MRHASIALMLQIFAAAFFASPTVLAAEKSGWLAQREAAFKSWQAANPGIARKIGELKEKTAVLVSAHAEQVKADAKARMEALIAHSRALSAEQKANIDALLQKAAHAAAVDDCAQAVTLFRQVLDIDPGNGDANFWLGDCLRRQGHLEEAAAYMTRATTIPPSGPETDNHYTKAMMTLQRMPVPPDPRIGEPPFLFRVADAPAEVWDAPEAPVMVIIPAGEFTMGSPPTEEFHEPQESPQHRVTIGYSLAFAKYNITRGEFAAFVDATGYIAKDGQGCAIWPDYPKSSFKRDPDADWRTPGFTQTDDDPVVCVNYHDGVAYGAWLTQKTGHTYRLPSEAEWEYAIRGGTTTTYYWGDEITSGQATCDGCNGPLGPGKPTPGGLYPPNPFGLYDMSGNVWKWLADCWNNTYVGTPADGSVWESGNCQMRGRRTGSWFNVAHARPGDRRPPTRLRSAARVGSIPDFRYASFGLRIVRELD